MPHQVVKCSVRGSVGDLAKITAALEAEGYNILAISASEVNHVGMLAMVFDPDLPLELAGLRIEAVHRRTKIRDDRR